VPLHVVVGKGRQVIHAAIDGDRQPPGGVVIAQKDIGHGAAPLLAGIPGLQDGGDVLRGPGDADGAAPQQDQDHRLAQGVEALQKLLLGPGQGQVGAVAPGKAGDLDGHLFALQVGRETQDGDDDVGILRCRQGDA